MTDKITEQLAQAKKCQQANNLAQAENIHKQILEQEPNCAEALHSLGLLLNAKGDYNAASHYLYQATTVDKTNPLYYFNLAELLRKMRKSEQAIPYYHKTLALKPDFAQAHYNLANLLVGQGRIVEATKHYRQTVQIDPTHARAILNLGTAMHRQGQIETAINHYRQAVNINPDFFEARKNLADLLREQGKGTEALSHYRQAVRIKPDKADIFNIIGALLLEQEQMEQAILSYKKAIQIDPNMAEAHNNIGGVWSLLGHRDKALKYYKRAVKINPQLYIAHFNIGAVIEEYCEIEKARATFKRAITLQPDNILLKLHTETLCPPIMNSNEEIDRYRTNFEATVDRYMGCNMKIDMSKLQISRAEPPLMLAYQGRADYQLKAKYARLFDGYFPTEPQKVGTGKPHIGFLVTYTHESIFIRCMKGIINRLSSNKFRLTIISNSRLCEQNIRKKITNPAVKYLTLPYRIDHSIEIIKAANIDLLYYWEIGTDSTNYFLPFCRLAPIQCTGWGWPDSSAIPQIDYYISSTKMVTTDSDSQFNETLIKLPSLPTYYHRPTIPKQLQPRSYFELPEDKHLYLCTQNLRKVHPDFDSIIIDILQHDPQGMVIFISDKYTAVTNLLLKRWQKTIPPDIAKSVKILPFIHSEQYLNLIALADVILDTPYFGGFNTTYDSLAIGTPIVTLPTAYQKGRYSYAIYKTIGVLDSVASSREDYINIALKLGTEPDYGTEISRKIKEASPILFENPATVPELEDFFEETLQDIR